MEILWKLFHILIYLLLLLVLKIKMKDFIEILEIPAQVIISHFKKLNLSFHIL